MWSCPIEYVILLTIILIINRFKSVGLYLIPLPYDTEMRWDEMRLCSTWVANFLTSHWDIFMAFPQGRSLFVLMLRFARLLYTCSQIYCYSHRFPGLQLKISSSHSDFWLQTFALWLGLCVKWSQMLRRLPFFCCANVSHNRHYPQPTLSRLNLSCRTNAFCHKHNLCNMYLMHLLEEGGWAEWWPQDFDRHD